MNKIFTLFTMGMVCLFANKANAQITETFENPLPSCFTLTNTTIVSPGISSNRGLELKNNTGTNAGPAPVYITTPFINFTGTSVTVSFDYSYENAIPNSKDRRFRVGLMSKDGSIAYSDGTRILTNNSPIASTLSFAVTSSVPGIYAVVIEYTADGGKASGTLDNLRTSNGTYYYGNSCNTSPVAEPNAYFTFQPTITLTGNVITDAASESNLSIDYDVDSTLDGKAFTSNLVTSIPDSVGTLTLSADGTFRFTPAATFAGGPISFTYSITDNGYRPATSAPATVTLNYPERLSILPVKVTALSAAVKGGKAQLSWTVADNATGSHFVIEKSTNGKRYLSAGVVYNTAKAGNESYQFTDATLLQGNNYYRLKIVNKDRTQTYSIVLPLKGEQSTGDNLTLFSNPVQNTLSFSFTANAAETNEIAIFNIAGVKVYSQRVQAAKGVNNISFNLNGQVTGGTYILSVQSISSNKTTRFIKQ